MSMGGDLLNGERFLLRACHLSQLVSDAILSCPHVDGNSALQVREGESLLAIAPIGRSNQLKQGFVFRDGQQLTVTKHPPRGREVAGKHSDFPYIWLGHKLFSSGLRREDSL